MTRQLSPYEKTHLQRFGKGDANIAEYGEMPVEYITGKVEFGGHVFMVNKDVLIPRVETEEMVNLVVAEAEKLGKKELVIADVGCGSGAIGISLWLKLQKMDIDVEMYLSDISTAAVTMTRENVATLIGQSDQVYVLESDLLENYPDNTKFDLIIANLPYIPSARVAVLDESVREYEPHLALDGGSDGLKYIRKLIKQAKEKLNSGGKILLEIDYIHDHQFLLNNLPLGKMKLETKQDQFQRTRFGIVTKT